MTIHVDNLPDCSSSTEDGANRVKVDWAKPEVGNLRLESRMRLFGAALVAPLSLFKNMKMEKDGVKIFLVLIIKTEMLKLNIYYTHFYSIG